MFAFKLEVRTKKCVLKQNRPTDKPLFQLINLFKVLFLSNRSTFAEVMHKVILVCIFMPDRVHSQNKQVNLSINGFYIQNTKMTNESCLPVQRGPALQLH